MTSQRRWPKAKPWSAKLHLPALALLLGIWGIAVLSGCGVRQLARGEITPPRVTLKAVTLSLPTAAGWPLSCALQLDNPNPQTLTLLGYDYDLWLEGRSVAQGASGEAVTLPALGQAVVEFPIFLKIPAVMGLMPSMLRPQQKLHYQISGGVRLASLLGGLRVPFKFQGEMRTEEALEHLRPYLK